MKISRKHKKVEQTIESFVKVFSKLSNFQVLEDESALEKSFKGWIARITVNTSIDKLRAQKATLHIDDINEIDIQHTPVSISTNLEVNDIMQLMNKLPDIQRMIFNLYDIEGDLQKQPNVRVCEEVNHEQFKELLTEVLGSIN